MFVELGSRLTILFLIVAIDSFKNN